MCRRVRPERQVVLLGGIAQVVEDYARLDSGDAQFRVQLQDLVEMARHVHHDGPVRGLARQAGAAATESHRRLVVATDADYFRQVFGVERPHDADRELAVVGRVRGVESAVAGRELDFAADSGAQVGGECLALGGGGAVVAAGACEQVEKRVRVVVIAGPTGARCLEVEMRVGRGGR